MKAWRRWLLIYAGLLFISMIATRFQIVSPVALQSGTAPITRVGVVAADNLRHAYMTIMHEREMVSELDKLRKENDALRFRNERLTRDIARFKQFEDIINTQSPNAVGTAQVVAVDPSPLLARLTLNLGKNAGVRIRMPVTVPAGLVGQVVDVSATKSTVIALVDPESSVGVTLQGSKGGRGIARGVPPDRMRAEFSRGVPIKPGDVLVTNSLGGVFPVGIRVGKVEKVLPLGPNDLNRTVILKPAVDVGVVEDVTILEGL